ncbi:hypothetical protein AXG93_203s1120 [Marchantia polymorpha subsp. ruderalis]|uniref:Uncharacterized protein n=1 Tax=Marchantia polymorpha subsp. ruderalis TaxID=1480154 RepID=A0A176VIJ8_MARPO|nr:hypothetical protein AXG93_203s1120 [Marchantia polymorpha subsp. ruderalis]
MWKAGGILLVVGNLGAWPNVITGFLKICLTDPHMIPNHDVVIAQLVCRARQVVIAGIEDTRMFCSPAAFQKSDLVDRAVVVEATRNVREVQVQMSEVLLTLRSGVDRPVGDMDAVHPG